MVARRTSIERSFDLHGEAAVLRQALLGDVEAAHEFQAGHQRARHAAAFDDLFLQHAVDAQAHAQQPFAGLDVHVGRARVDGVLEDGLDEADDRRVGRALVDRELR